MAAPKTKCGTATEHAQQPARLKSNFQAERNQNHMEAAQADRVDDEHMEELAGKLADFVILSLQELCCSELNLSKDD